MWSAALRGRPCRSLHHQSRESSFGHHQRSTASLQPTSINHVHRPCSHVYWRSRQSQKSASNTHCQPKAIPTSILEKSADIFAPLFAALCNSSDTSGLPPILRNMPWYQLDSRKLWWTPTIWNLTCQSSTDRSRPSWLNVRLPLESFCTAIRTLLPVRQSAFGRHHSTETAVRPIVHNDIIRAINNGQLTVMMFLDFSSAFDTVDHDIMLSILHRRFSVEVVSLNLTDRSQTFSVGDSKSYYHRMSCSVPHRCSDQLRLSAAKAELIWLFGSRSTTRHRVTVDNHSISLSHSRSIFIHYLLWQS